MDKKPIVFRDRMRKLMTSKGMRLREFAETAGVPYKTALRWTWGEHTPPRAREKKICAQAGWNESLLLGDYEEREPVERELFAAIAIYERRLAHNLPLVPAALARIGHLITQYTMERGVPCTLRQDIVGVCYIDLVIPSPHKYQLQIGPSSGEGDGGPEILVRRGDSLAFRLPMRARKDCIMKIQKLIKEITAGHGKKSG